MEKIGYSLIRSSLCHVGIVWAERDTGTRIVRIFLSRDDDGARKRIKRLFPGAKISQNKEASLISEKIKCYLKGEIARFNLSYIQRSLRSKFQRAVSCAARQIPYGRVVTYRGLARLIGSKSARAAGNALAKNPFPIVIPCHRVVGFNRKIGGFQSGKNLKKDLLKLEGVTFDKKGRILEKYFFYPLNAIR